MAEFAVMRTPIMLTAWRRHIQVEAGHRGWVSRFDFGPRITM